MRLIHWCFVWLFAHYVVEVKAYVCNYVAEIGDLFCKDVNIGILEGGVYPLNDTNLSEVRRLNIEKTNLSAINSDAFHELQGLVYLEMNENKLQELDNNLFKNTSNLRQLLMAHNQIRTLNKILFEPISKLTHLDISHNPLSSLASDPKVFTSLRNLLFLRADNINLRKIPTDLMEPLTSLKEVTLNDNGIQCRCNLRNSSQWVKEKCISMKITCDGKNGRRYSDLESYYRDRCGPNRRLKTRIVHKTDNAYFPRPNIYLPAQRRRKHWDYPIFDDYSNYPFRRGIPYRPVEEEYVYDNTDTNDTIPVAEFGSNCSRKECRYSQEIDLMDCEGNEISIFNNNHYPFQERRFSELILDNNKLMKLEENSFVGLSELTTLSLRRNGLRSLDPNVFKPLENLIFLDMSDNQLGSLYEVKLFSSQNKLRILYLSNDGIVSVDQDVLKHMRSLKRVFFENNNLDCNCELKPVVLRLQKRKVLNKGTCRRPPLYDGQPWIILKKATYCRLPLNSIGYKSEGDPITLTLIFFGVILLIIGAIQLIYYALDKFHKPKPGGPVYYIPPDFDIF